MSTYTLNVRNIYLQTNLDKDREFTEVVDYRKIEDADHFEPKKEILKAGTPVYENLLVRVEISFDEKLPSTLVKNGIFGNIVHLIYSNVNVFGFDYLLDQNSVNQDIYDLVGYKCRIEVVHVDRKFVVRDIDNTRDIETTETETIIASQVKEVDSNAL